MGRGAQVIGGIIGLATSAIMLFIGIFFGELSSLPTLTCGIIFPLVGLIGSILAIGGKNAGAVLLIIAGLGTVILRLFFFPITTMTAFALVLPIILLIGGIIAALGNK